MENTQNIKLQLSLEEVNTLLTALGNLPYVQVFELVQKIQQQAAQQVNTDNKKDKKP